MFTYVILKNLPDVPEKFITSAMQMLELRSVKADIVKDNLSDDYKNRKLLINNESKSVTYQTRVDIDAEFNDWVHKNIHPEGFDCGLSITDSKHGSHQGPHTDLTRDFTMIYLLDPGGPNTETVFYEEEGKPIVRKERQAVCNDFSKLRVLDRVKFPTRKWAMLNAMCLHGVENIEGIRVSFQISANSNPWFD
jgi:hypothetical protein